MTRFIGLTAAIFFLAGSPATAQYASRSAVGHVTMDSPSGRDHGAGARTGALWGAGVGAGIGLLAALTGDSCTNYGNGAGTQCEKFSGTERGIAVALFTTLGTIVGAAVGAVVGKESEDARTSSRAALQITPTRAEMRFAF